jgi:uncharacterized protein (DUF486 family)
VGNCIFIWNQLVPKENLFRKCGNFMHLVHMHLWIACIPKKFKHHYEAFFGFFAWYYHLKHTNTSSSLALPILRWLTHPFSQGHQMPLLHTGIVQFCSTHL